MVFWPVALKGVRGLCRRPLGGWVLEFEARWHALPTRGLGGEPKDPFGRKRTKPPHKTQGYGQGLKF